MNISVHAEADRNAISNHDLANAVRFLAIDAIETSQSGHPGLPMGMADVATVLFSRFLKFDAANPNWPDRDDVEGEDRRGDADGDPPDPRVEVEGGIGGRGEGVGHRVTLPTGERPGYRATAPP